MADHRTDVHVPGRSARHLIESNTMARMNCRFPAPIAAPERSRRVPGGRVLRRSAVWSATVIAASTLLGGCAVEQPLAWRIEGNTRIAHGGLDGAAAGYLALARRYEGEHRTALAADAYRKAVRESPSSADVLQSCALGLAAQGDLVSAIAWLQRAAELRPDQASIANNLGYALMLAGRDAEAAAPLQRAMALAPAYRAAQINWDQLEQRQLALRTGPAATRVAGPAEAAAVVAPPVQAIEPRDGTAAVGVRFAANVSPLVVSFASEPGERPAAPAAPELPSVAAVTTAATGAAVPASTVRVDVVNGNGVSGLAAHWRHWLQTQGVATGRLSNLLPYDTALTVVQYRPGFQADAQSLAAQLKPGVNAVALPGLPLNAPVRILIGHDSAKADLS